jgi:hypothetical protein
MKKYKFDINLMGKQVIVTQVLERQYDKDKRFWKPVNVIERRVGWIVGHSTAHSGIYHRGSSYTTGYETVEYDYIPSHLEVTEILPCLLVTYWPNQKPIKIPVDGFIEYNEENCKDCSLIWKKPYCSSGYGEGTDRIAQLEATSRIIKSVANRDEKGRFTK